MKVTYTKNRFEIDGVLVINPNVIQVTWVTTDSTSYFYKGAMLKYGDSFDLPDNIIAEKETTYVEPDENILWSRGWDETVYRLKLKEPLVDTGSKETQEELWNEVLNTCEEHMINDIRLLEMLVKKYSITRK